MDRVKKHIALFSGLLFLTSQLIITAHFIFVEHHFNFEQPNGIAFEEAKAHECDFHSVKIPKIIFQIPDFNTSKNRPTHKKFSFYYQNPELNFTVSTIFSRGPPYRV